MAVNFDANTFRENMSNTDNIRNISIIAHVDHGKTTLTDSLVRKAGFISEESAGKKRFTDVGEEEQARGITIKSTGVTMEFEINEKLSQVFNIPLKSNNSHIINLIDSPGHVDFSSEVTSALRCTDGAAVIVDCVEGVSVQTETVLRQALQERIKPVLVINKLDRFFFELQLSGEEIYQRLCDVINKVNEIVTTYNDGFIEDLYLTPVDGSVVFASGYQQWGFNLAVFAHMYNPADTPQAITQREKMVEKMWGENYIDPVTKKFHKTEKQDNSQEKLPRGFSNLVIDPILKLYKNVISGNKEELQKFTDKMGLKLTAEENPRELFRQIMMKWLPLSECLFGTIVKHLPSPKVAQAYRADILYDGDLTDEHAEAIRKCDPNGELIMYISKMIATDDNARFIAFGRVFSGTVKQGMDIKVVPPEYEHSKRNYATAKVQGTSVSIGRFIRPIDQITCGNTGCLLGIDRALAKSGTVTTSVASGDKILPKIKDMKHSVSPVYTVAVQPKNLSNIDTLVKGLARLSKSDPLVKIKTDQDTGEMCISGAGELHMEICLNELKKFCKDIDFTSSPPVTAYRETVTELSSVVCMAKSPNKHNRLYFTCEPLDAQLVTDIESGDFDMKMDEKTRSRLLVDKYGWNMDEAKKIWAFGPETVNTNVLVDCTKGAQYLNEIRDSIVGGFLIASSDSVLGNEEMRGIRFNLVDVVLHADAIHRGAGQLMPTTRRVLSACVLASKPRFVEPIYLVEITVPEDKMGGVYQTMNKRRGQINNVEQKGTTPIFQMKAFLPVAESFGFDSELRGETSGKAFPQCVFSHWEIMQSDPLTLDTQSNKIMFNMRKRKGLKCELPKFDEYNDKL